MYLFPFYLIYLFTMNVKLQTRSTLPFAIGCIGIIASAIIFHTRGLGVFGTVILLSALHSFVDAFFHKKSNQYKVVVWTIRISMGILVMIGFYNSEWL